MEMQIQKKIATYYVGVDVGKKKCVTCVMDQDGTISENSSYPNTYSSAHQYANHLVEEYGNNCKAVVESTGNMWMKTYEAFESAGIEIKLANPVKTRAIAEAKVKTDKIDSKTLARLLRGDNIAECYVPSKDIRLSRSLLGHRVNIVREQTRIKNRIHTLLDKYDFKCEYESMFSGAGIKWLHGLNIIGHDKSMLESLLRQLEFFSNEEQESNSEIASEGLRNKYVLTIMSMTGFDYYGASVLAAYIGDINRFRSPSRLVSWVGMCPSVHQTGETTHYGKMKDGSKKVKWIMSEAANTAALFDPRMKSFYERKFKRHSHNIAITHVANKMLRILWYMLSNNQLYNERKEKLYSSKLKRMARTAE
jgi:transposase